MNTLYTFLTGPMVWIAFAVFIGGIIIKLLVYGMIARKKDGVIYEYTRPYFALRSILHWIVPYGSVNMRRHPIFTIVSFAFHICLLAVPLFLVAHIIMVNDAWALNWWHLPDTIADVMTVVVIAACIFFAFRRVTQPEVKFLTSASDYVLLAVVAAPFVTGFWAQHQWAGYPVAAVLHILSGEIFLMAIPFTRLSHMFFFFFTRGYIGSEFGGVRHAQDW